MLARWRGEAGAAAAYKELLAERMRVLGRDHLDTLTTRDNLAVYQGEAGGVAGAVTASASRPCRHSLRPSPAADQA